MKKRLVLLTTALFMLSAVFSISLYPASGPGHDTAVKTEQAADIHSADSAAGSHAGAGIHHAPHIDAKNLSLFWIIPFVGILLSIALFPLVRPHFWHHHYGKVSLFWGVVFFAAFTAYFGISTGVFYLLEVYLLEFIPFITLLLALFTVAGGIQLKGELAGTPKVNTIMILIGAVLASFMGTTGAAMVVIRP
ncbi:MAG TPA: sodium:proton antiporter, partial [Spirochaetota bacterium]|nr:sodium:proton antiporter [Spirochaetota bacterium]